MSGCVGLVLQPMRESVQHVSDGRTWEEEYQIR